jgi:1-acyl-sn-glycerol-3-phosphate acyltransferase
MIKRESLGRKKENTAYLMIYPEGKRTLDSNYELLPFKKGAFHLSLDSNLPIIPVSSFGGMNLMPKSTYKLPKEKDRNYYLKIHSPIFPKNFLFECASKEGKKKAIENMIEITRTEIESGIKFLKSMPAVVSYLENH